MMLILRDDQSPILDFGARLLSPSLPSVQIQVRFGSVRFGWAAQCQFPRFFPGVMEWIRKCEGDALNLKGIGAAHFRAKRFEDALVAFGKALASCAALPSTCTPPTSPSLSSPSKLRSSYSIFFVSWEC